MNLVRMIYNYTRSYVIIRNCVNFTHCHTVILFLLQYLYIRQVSRLIATVMHVHNFNPHCGYSSVLSTRRITLLLGNVSNPFLLLKLLYLAYVDVSVSQTKLNSFYFILRKTNQLTTLTFLNIYLSNEPCEISTQKSCRAGI